MRRAKLLRRNATGAGSSGEICLRVSGVTPLNRGVRRKYDTALVTPHVER